MWRFITQLEDLLKYFLDLKQGRLLKRDFTFKILSNLRNQEFKEQSLFKSKATHINFK